MRAILSIAHCHGDLLGPAWHIVLTTLQGFYVASLTEEYCRSVVG